MAHCRTCACGDHTRWFPYKRDDDPRATAYCSGGSARCPGRFRRNDVELVVLHVTDRGARRYLCARCAQEAGFDGTFTTTLGDTLLSLRERYDAGEIDVAVYLAQVNDALVPA